jgi:hypothetical protein
VTRPARRRPIHSPAEVRGRVLWFTLLALVFLALSLLLGVLGYRAVLGLSWIDALLNAAMILTGMGPVDDRATDAGKLFASAYALYGGAVYPAATALVLCPLVHRMLNLLHIARDEDRE